MVAKLRGYGDQLQDKQIGAPNDSLAVEVGLVTGGHDRNVGRSIKQVRPGCRLALAPTPAQRTTRTTEAKLPPPPSVSMSEVAEAATGSKFGAVMGTA